MLDANGTRHHLVFGEEDWLSLAGQTPTPGDGPVPETRYDSGRVELTLRPNVVTGAPADVPLSARRGAAVDGGGNVYWVDSEQTSILVQSPTTGISTLWPAPMAGGPAAPGAFAPSSAECAPPTPGALRGLTVTTENYLVAGTTDPDGLLVFDLQAPGSPHHLPWTASAAFVPFQIVSTSDGGALILDTSASPAYWRLDRAFNVTSAGAPSVAEGRAAGAFRPAAGAEAPRATGPNFTPISARLPHPDRRDAVALDGDPIAIAALGTWVLILCSGPAEGSSELRIYRDGALAGEAIPLGNDATEVPIVGHDMVIGPALAEETAAAHLYVASATRAQAFEFTLAQQGETLTVALTSRFIPLRQYGGRGLVYGPMYDFGARWVALASQPPMSYVANATIVTHAFDGSELGCTWHRLMLDAIIPPGCAVKVFSRANDDQASLPGLEFSREPGPAPRPDGSEQPYVTLPEGWSTFETLFQHARGRWLQLKLVIAGDGRTTPRLRALRAYYPRFSYLERYLPAVYRADAASASFLDRFLANVEGINTTIEGRIAAAQALLDPRAAPSDALEWLASFFDVALDPAWSEDRSRLFVEHVMEFFRRRGTVLGLQMALRLALDNRVDESVFQDPPDARTLSYRVVELFGSPLPGSATLTAPAAQTGPRVVQVTTPWNPTLGLDALRGDYERFRSIHNLRAHPVREVPLVIPSADSEAGAEVVLRSFWTSALGFEPPGPESKVSWTQFLSQRYASIDALNAAYAPGVQPPPYSTFLDVELPSAVPDDGPQQLDWYQFASLVLPASRNAHRFVVLLPAPSGAAEDPSMVDPAGQLNLASRLIDLAKPAHTTYQVRFYWAAFQIGDARLEHDTTIELGSRTPQLRVPALLGGSAAGSSFLGGPRPPVLAPHPSVARNSTLPD